MRRALGLLVACAVCAAGASAPDSATADEPLAPRIVPGELIVRYAPATTPSERIEIRERADLARPQSLVLPRLQLVELEDPDDGVREAARRLSSLDGVAYAEPNRIRTLDATPNDPRFGELWGLVNHGQEIQGEAGVLDADIDANRAWNVTTGDAGVTVAVVDTGLASDHPDLDQRVWANPGESGSGTSAGSDDDGNGLVDDVNGWDFFFSKPLAGDSQGHGTHVAGTIAAEGDNATGTTGVAWDARIMPLRACVIGGCSTAAVAAAFAYAGDEGADVLNASLGGPGFSQAMDDAIAASPETLFVFSAGNEGTNNDASGGAGHKYPCDSSQPNVICVAWTNHLDGLSNLSNYGAQSVDLGAPGGSVLSTWPSFEQVWRDDFEGQRRWDYLEPGEPADASRWRRVAGGPGGQGIEDSPGSDYPASNSATVTLTDPVDLSGERGCVVEPSLTLDVADTNDTFFVEASADPGSGNWLYLAGFNRDLPSYGPAAFDLTKFDGASEVYLRMTMQSDATGTADGAHVGEVSVRCNQPGAGDYVYSSGTSMAAPHVSGAAALLLADEPALSVEDLRDAILDSVDPLPALAGKTVTGGRLNVANALLGADTAPPDTAIDPGTPASFNDESVTIGFSSAEPAAAFQCSLDGLAFRLCSGPGSSHTAGPFFSEGEHVLAVRAIDEAGNPDPTPAEHEFAIDYTPPDLTLDPSPAATSDPTPTFSFRSPDPGAHFRCAFDGAPLAPCSDPGSHTPVAPLGDGRHGFRVTAVDSAGNFNPPAERMFRVDTAGPSIRFVAGPSGSTTDRTPRFSFSTSEPASSLRCRLDGRPISGCRSPLQLARTSLGAHRLTVGATDRLGNRGPQGMRSFRVVRRR